jgi:gamma-glutamyltranspeptidase / glutathione hydrolase
LAVLTTSAVATGGMVATSHPLATEAGLEVLGAGGNAVDAALAAAAVTWVVLPMMCGPGGDAFALVFDPRDREVIGVGSGGTAPRAATPEWFGERGHRLIPFDGPLSVGVPGALGVMEELADRFGRLEFRDHFASAIRHADRGFPVSQAVATHFANHAARLAGDPASSRKYGNVQEGSLLAQYDLARTIEAIALEGASILYRGRLADAIAEYMQQSGGLLTREDLSENRVDVYAAPSIEYRGSRVFETAPPSQGFVVLEELKILESFDLAALPAGGEEAIHLMVEAKKLAVEDRLRYAGDPRVVSWDLERLLSAEHAGDRARLIDRSQSRSRTAVPAADGDTTYLCAVDRDGLAVSFVHSLSAAFGAAVCVPGTGILLNNRVGRGFTLEPGHPNRLAPQKRTMSTLNCYLVTRDDRPAIVGGTPGGDGQVQWNLQILSSLLDRGSDPQVAVSEPRWTHGPTTDPWTMDDPETLKVEDRVPESTLEGLRRRGHPVKTVGPWAGGGSAQVITIDGGSGILRGGSDPRGGGLALGR